METLRHGALTDISLCAPCRRLVSVQQSVHVHEGGFPPARRGQHTDQRLPHHAQRPLLLRYKPRPPLLVLRLRGIFLVLFLSFKHKHHLLCFSTEGMMMTTQHTETSGVLTRQVTKEVVQRSVTGGTTVTKKLFYDS